MLVNGTFDGEASILKFKMINSQGEVIETITENLENNSFDNLLVQPKKSGNYSIELTLYNDNGYLQDYYIRILHLQLENK